MTTVHPLRRPRPYRPDVVALPRDRDIEDFYADLLHQRMGEVLGLVATMLDGFGTPDHASDFLYYLRLHLEHEGYRMIDNYIAGRFFEEDREGQTDGQGPDDPF